MFLLSKVVAATQLCHEYFQKPLCNNNTSDDDAFAADTFVILIVEFKVKKSKKNLYGLG